jgi:hypothetical protein
MRKKKTEKKYNVYYVSFYYAVVAGSTAAFVTWIFE